MDLAHPSAPARRFWIRGVTFLAATLAASVAGAAAPATAPAAAIVPPVPADDRLTVQLVAAEPDVVTPTGIAVDARGRAWVIENNTHFAPKGYAGHPTDRILVMDDYGDDGRARKISVFADGLKDSMSLALGKAPGEVYLVTRNQITILRDADGDGKADDAGRPIVRLETKATYPHNGLNGVTFSPDGRSVYFCLGLNTGYPYAVVGSDGSRVAGGGEGGSIWRCGLDGSKVERIATGFWNCHDLTFDAFGRLFAVDNDPDDRPPCRLLDIIEGGDYGWQFRNGRKGIHPFTSWFGEHPGTLPMVSPVGEAPCGVLAYESNDLPDEYRGQLLVTSWGDHFIQHFKLEPKGASFTAKPEILVQGGVDFRPVGIATAPDGSLLVSDWVDKSYPVHGRGRVWRVRAKQPPKDDGVRPDNLAGKTADELRDLLAHPRREVAAAAAGRLAGMGRAGLAALDHAVSYSPDERVRMQALMAAPFLGPEDGMSLLRGGLHDRSGVIRGEVLRMMGQYVRASPDRKWREWSDIEENLPPQLIEPYALRQGLLALVPESTYEPTGFARNHPDPFVTSAVVTALMRSTHFADIVTDGPDLTGREWKLMVEVLAMRRSGQPALRKYIPSLLKHESGRVRWLALQWVGEERLTEFADQIDAALKAGPVTREVLEAVFAARQKLTTEPPEEGKPPTEFAAGKLATTIVFDESYDPAIRQIALELADPRDKAFSADKLKALVKPLGVGAVRALAWREDAASQAVLRDIAADAKGDAGQRLDAIAGLAPSAATTPETKQVLHAALGDQSPTVRREALRSLRGALGREDAARLAATAFNARPTADVTVSADEREWAEQVLLAFRATPDAMTDADRAKWTALATPRPADEAAWQKALADGGDIEAGRRVFFHATAARCFVCHTVDNRGGLVGPDLSHVASAMDRRKLVESVIDPSREIAPLYVPVILKLRDGDVVTGITGLEDVGNAETVVLHDATGKAVKVKAADIVSRRLDTLSIMPNGLPEAMTVQEFRDLIAFLASRR